MNEKCNNSYAPYHPKGHCQAKEERKTVCLAIDYNTNAPIVRLIARVVFIRHKDVCPVISLVTDQR